MFLFKTYCTYSLGDMEMSLEMGKIMANSILGSLGKFFTASWPATPFSHSFPDVWNCKSNRCSLPRKTQDAWFIVFQSRSTVGLEIKLNFMAFKFKQVRTICFWRNLLRNWPKSFWFRILCLVFDIPLFDDYQSCLFE